MVCGPHGRRAGRGVSGAPAPWWDPDTDDRLVCSATWEETHDVRTFLFVAPEPRRFAYAAGQFVTFTLPIHQDGEPVSRCYTLASSPTRPDTVSITVKRVPGGPASNWLHDNLRPGVSLPAAGPMGDFTNAASSAKAFLFLSGGSGITPLMAMARRACDLALDHDIVFVPSARTPDDLVFRDELMLMAHRNPRFRPIAVCEGDGRFERWTGYRGRLSLAMLRSIVPDFSHYETYCCGPSPYMAAVRALLVEGGYDMARYHQESFDFADLAAAEPALATEVIAAEEEQAPSVPTYQISFAKSGRVIECAADTTVLDAARRAGLRLPSSCTKGVCGTCKSKLVSGSVDMKAAGGIRQREIDAGMVLLCCSRPTADLVVER